MDPQLKERLVGAAVLVVAGILFIPQLLDGPDERPAVKVGLELPAPDDGRRTHTIRLDVPAERPATKSTGSIIRPTADADMPRSSEPEPEAEAEPEPEPEPGPAPPSPTTAPEDETAARPAVKAPASAGNAAPPSEPLATTVESPAPPPARPEPAGDWAVQVGSFSSEDNARRLQGRLESAGFETFQTRLVTDSGTMHRVRVGPVEDRPAADSLAARLGQAGYPGRVVQVSD